MLIDKETTELELEEMARASAEREAAGVNKLGTAGQVSMLVLCLVCPLFWLGRLGNIATGLFAAVLLGLWFWGAPGSALVALQWWCIWALVVYGVQFFLRHRLSKNILKTRMELQPAQEEEVEGEVHPVPVSLQLELTPMEEHPEVVMTGVNVRVEKDGWYAFAIRPEASDARAEWLPMAKSSAAPACMTDECSGKQWKCRYAVYHLAAGVHTLAYGAETESAVARRALFEQATK